MKRPSPPLTIFVLVLMSRSLEAVSPSAENQRVLRRLTWRFDNEQLTPQSLGERFHRPERIKASLKVEISSVTAP